MSTIMDLGKGKQTLRAWDEDPAACGGWRTKPVWLDAVNPAPKRIHLAGLGDVGMNAALGLVLTGGGIVGHLGLYDLKKEQCERLRIELSQIAAPPAGRTVDEGDMPQGRRTFPEIEVVEKENLFDCDIFAFCATRSIPAVGSGVKDVRMAQYEANRVILAGYAQEAARVGFKGLFAVVSDPVDLLCMEALRTAREAGAGGRALTTDQIVGCGLGVMYARAKYYAGTLPGCEDFPEQGRVFGPHGQGLVAANSTDPAKYDDVLSKKLTELTVQANMQVRALGYKPYLAPAMSSAVLTLLALIKGEWNNSAAYLNGLYFGALNRQTPEGIEWERQELPDRLHERLAQSYRHLEELIWG